MVADDSKFCVTRCCRAVAVTLAFALAAMWAISSVSGRDPDHGSAPSGSDVLDLKNPRVVVLKSKRRLYLFDGQRLVRTYAIALGFTPTGDKQQLGDGRTPEGVFRVCSRKQDSRYHRFLGIDYPGAAGVDRGLARGLLTPGEAQAILGAQADGRCPPWTTALGGAIGMHGLGGADPDPGADWTAGCVALADAHIEELFDVLRLGDPVEILP
jgi:hypothetical protein